MVSVGLRSLLPVENVNVVMQGAVSAVQLPEAGTAGLESVPVFAAHLRMIRVAAPGVL